MKNYLIKDSFWLRIAPSTFRIIKYIPELILTPLSLAPSQLIVWLPDPNVLLNRFLIFRPLISRTCICTLDNLERLNEFANKVKQQKQELLSLLIELKKSNKKVIGVGAPAKGITLLNYCKIDSDLIEYITEKAPLKIGKYTPGTTISVVDDAKIDNDKPDYALLLSWNFADEIIKNIRKNYNYQGKFIIPIPYPKIV